MMLDQQFSLAIDGMIQYPGYPFGAIPSQPADIREIDYLEASADTPGGNIQVSVED